MENKKNQDRMLWVDTHVHSEYSHDSNCPLSDICQSALEKGIDVVSITDHCDIYPSHDVNDILSHRKQAFEAIARMASVCDGQKLPSARPIRI